MIIYEFKDFEGELRTRRVVTSVDVLRHSLLLGGKDLMDFETRDGDKAIMYYDDFFNRIVVSVEE